MPKKVIVSWVYCYLCDCLFFFLSVKRQNSAGRMDSYKRYYGKAHQQLACNSCLTKVNNSKLREKTSQIECNKSAQTQQQPGTVTHTLTTQ